MGVRKELGLAEAHVLRGQQCPFLAQGKEGALFRGAISGGGGGGWGLWGWWGKGAREACHTSADFAECYVAVRSALSARSRPFSLLTLAFPL